jgi:succinoglycan biosynthesis protein ExoA
MGFGMVCYLKNWRLLVDNPCLVSVIFPIRNEENYIEASLGAVLAQDYPADSIEIIVADGMSTDSTRERIMRVIKDHPTVSLRILDNPGKIVPAGMNIALRQSNGQVIIRVDGHCIIAPDYVRKCVDHIQNDYVDGVGGPMESIGETPLAKAIAVAMSSIFGVGNSDFRTTSGRTMFVDTVPFPAYARGIIERVGLYDEELVRNQDDEYNYRIREAGGKILLADDVRSAYFSRTSILHLSRQFFQYGFWKVRVFQKHPRQMSLRQFVPPVFVLALLLSFFFVFVPGLRVSSLFLPACYILTNILVSTYTASKQGWKYVLQLPVIFAILHLSYGFGFLTGMIKFAARWGDKLGKVPGW